ncbi:MAG: hypothetical protein AB1611_13445 [bacterium]
MDHLNERIQSALELFLYGCQIWAEIIHHQDFLDELESIKAEFERISYLPHNEETVSTIENMTMRILSDLDLAMRDMGLGGLELDHSRYKH